MFDVKYHKVEGHDMTISRIIVDRCVVYEK